MRLVIFFPVRVYYNNDTYASTNEDSNLFYQFLFLKQYFDEIDLVVMLKKGTGSNFENVVELGDFKLHGLPFCRDGYELHIRNLPQMIYSLIKLFLKHRHDWDVILVFKSFLPNHICFLLAKVFRKPIVFYVNGGHEIFRWDLYYKVQTFPKKLAGWFLSKYYEFAAKIMIKHAITVVDSKDVFDIFKNDNKHLYKIFSTLITSKDIVEEKEVQRHSEGTNVISVLTVCRVHPQKGLEYLIDAVSNVRTYGINIILNIVGSLMGTGYGNYEGFLREKISNLRLSDCVKFIGQVGDRERLKNFYKCADMFVLPSLSEGSPKVIPEAMASGLPIIATNIASIPDLIQDGVEGILIEPRDVDALTNAIMRLASDPSLRHRMGRSALEKAKELTLEVRTEKFANVIKSSLLEVDNQDYSS